MLSVQRLVFEVIVLGILACAVGALVSRVTGMQGLALYFAIGAVLHLGFELAGLNEWYCRSRP
jgi:hypothetical protein